MRIDCSAPRTATPTASTNSPNNTSFTPSPPASSEKKSDGKTMGAISAIETCEQKKKGEPEQADDLDRRVNRNPAQHVGSDYDPEHDLEHDRRQPDPREESEGKRSRQRRRRDDRQSTERDRKHRALSVTSRRRCTHSEYA